MTCAKCGTEFKAAEGAVCPSCGAKVRPGNSGVLRSSTILISAGDTEGIFRSVKEVPPPLRTKLMKSTNGINSATILIADRRGREEIARALRRVPSTVRKLGVPSIFGATDRDGDSITSHPLLYRAIAWVCILLSFVFVWLVFTRKWF